MIQIIGTVVVFGCVLGGFVLEGGHILALWHLTEILIIVGAAFGAFLISNPPKIAKAAIRQADQLLLDVTPEGLSIQIVDAQNRPMFDLGSSRLKPYTRDILEEVAHYLETVPNRISITGHTDTSMYAGISGYTNWDLSTDRANAARRALEAAAYDTTQIARIAGLSSSVLFDKENPKSPVNRRISIVVMTQAAEEIAQRIDIPAATPVPSKGEPTQLPDPANL